MGGYCDELEMSMDKGGVFRQVELLAMIGENEKIRIGYDLDIGFESKKVLDFGKNRREGGIGFNGRYNRYSDETIHSSW